MPRAMPPQSAERLTTAVATGSPRSWRTRWAAFRLDRAGRRGHQAAVEAAWSRWLTEPADPVWELLERWRRPAATGNNRELSRIALGAERAGPEPVDRPTLIDAAARTDHPIGAAARAWILASADPVLVDGVCAAAQSPGADPVLVEFCAEHGLVPADLPRRAVFLVLTGQEARLAQVDPDGTELVRGYAAAGAGERARLRAALVAAGQLDLVQVVATDRPRWIASAHPSDVDAVGAQLAGRQDWTELWRLVRDGPLVAGLDLIDRFPAAWRPADAEDRGAFEALAAASPEARAAVSEPLGHHLRLAVPAAPRSVSFAPGGTEVAVLGAERVAPGGDRQTVLAVHRLPGGEAAWRQPLPAYDRWDRARAVVHVGAGQVILGGGLLAVVKSYLFAPFWRAGGTTVAGQLGQLSGGFVARKPPDTLHRGSVTGAVTSLDRLRLPGPGPYRLLAADAAQDTVVLCGTGSGPGSGTSDELVLLDRADDVLARGLHPGRVRRLVHLGAGGVVTVGRRRAGERVTAPDEYDVRLWRRDGDVLALAATAAIDVPGAVRCPPLGVLPALSRLRFGEHWLGTADLAPVPAPDPAWPLPYWTSLDRMWLATPAGTAAEPGGVDLYRLRVPSWLAALVDRPVARLDRADFVAAEHTVRTAADPVAAEVAGLLRGLLHLRFGADIAVGAGGSPTADPAAIGLADRDGPT